MSHELMIYWFLDENYSTKLWYFRLLTGAASFGCLLVLPALAANLFMMLTYAAKLEMLAIAGFEPGTAAL